MRMWMVDAACMCDKHLLGEHVECHMLAGSLARKRSIDGFIANGLLEVSSLETRHEALAVEMTARGFRHASPIDVPDTDYLASQVLSATVDVEKSERDLAQRCATCCEGLQSARRR